MKTLAAQRVLARRLLGAAVLSKLRPEAVTQLPSYENVYAGRNFPEVDECKEMIRTFFNASAQNRVAIVAGVDELQLLDAQVNIGGKGLGHLFLRWLRQWQVQWFKTGICLLPVGTGVLLRFPSEDPTDGRNIPIENKKADSDAVLIKRADFKEIVRETLDDETFSQQRRGLGEVSTDAAAEQITAVWYPRLRLLEWWRRGVDLSTITDDGNASKWSLWMQKWMLNENLWMQKKEDLPGHPNGPIQASFQMVYRSPGSAVQVIPDGYNAGSILKALENDLPAPFLYDTIKRMVPRSMKPTEFIAAADDHRAFEDFGFGVLGIAIHLGMNVLTKQSMRFGRPTSREARGTRLLVSATGMFERGSAGVRAGVAR
uniref:Uncharacterized protein n=1 Tax=Chromera velia CCMP2878 TaxID=1169474 RepID=A0A0G4GQ84_9ALVE|eukprot:Cvel_22891.t1-p1 / transcript=Cvel_22891.t1 / gene=Cvel_22891 / organism=Chromera_velia_CCMP2878 / gene_product=hypothetical protein / transcript_product=hypothetical protein / location=Cvel_scaffold2300:1243-2355(-) / protein_length=371 / sequence_SO=supercontig / SO=protein_coding / is_pseudo=false